MLILAVQVSIKQLIGFLIVPIKVNVRYAKTKTSFDHAEQKRLVAAGEDGLIGLVKDRFNENQKDEISNVALARIFRDNDPSIFREDGKLLKEVVKSLLNNTRKLLGQTHIQTLSLEQLLETLTQTQPAKGKQVVEDLYAKCNLALGLNKVVMSRQPETHYYFFNNVGNSSLRNYIKELFQRKANDVSFVDYKSIKSIRMVKACFGFDIADIYFYRNYEEAYKMFHPD